MKALKIVAAAAVALAALYFLAAVTLIYWPADIFKDRTPPPAPTLVDYPHAERRFVARDGKQLFARVFGPAAETSIVLVHGFGVNSDAYQNAASAWAEASGARVVA